MLNYSSSIKTVKCELFPPKIPKMYVFVSLTCALFVVPKIFLVHLMFSPPFFSSYPWAHLMKGRKRCRDGFDDLIVFPWRDSAACVS